MHRGRPIMANAALLLILLYLIAPGPIGAAEQPDATEAFRMPGGQALRVSMSDRPPARDAGGRLPG